MATTTTTTQQGYGAYGTVPAGQGAVYVPVYSQSYGPYDNTPVPATGIFEDQFEDQFE